MIYNLYLQFFTNNDGVQQKALKEKKNIFLISCQVTWQIYIHKKTFHVKEKTFYILFWKLWRVTISYKQNKTKKP